MCQFFSFCTDEFGKKYYFNWEQRVKMKHVGVDSHDHIIAEYKLKDSETNCFEFNPLTRKFETDKINTIDNRIRAEEWVSKLDFKKIVEPLIIKPIENPLKGRAKKLAQEQIQWLKDWGSVRTSAWDSVRTSVWDSVWASVWDSAWDSVRASVRDSVGASVGASVRASVGASVRDSVWASVRDSVGDSVGAYIGSFFRLPRAAWKYTEKIQTKDYPFQPVVDLWNIGLVPSFDGTIWRLHGGPKAKILWSGKC
jgi:hypothetical protein